MRYQHELETSIHVAENPMHSRNIPFFCITVCVCCFMFTVQTKQAGGAVEDPPMAKLFLELYKSEDKNVALGSMLLSVEMSNTENLEKFLRASANDNDTQLEKCIKLYTISKFTSDFSDIKKFIAAFPDDKENFWELINFECTVTRCPHSNMLTYLIAFMTMDYDVITKTDIELSHMAREKIEKILPLSDGWVRESMEYFLKAN